MPLSAGERLGPYEIVSPLGAGGMGEVYRAKDTRLGREVALKILPMEMAQDPDRLARFQREARTVAALNHPNIVTLFSVEHCNGFRFLTMELVEGQPLDRMIPKDGFTVDRIFDIAAALAAALAAAHEKGIVHRDLKPANIMITHDGRVKVLDFGIAKDVRTPAPEEVTRTSVGDTLDVVMGTPPYMSPEQVSGRAVDQRSDIFSLGIILHEIATGRRPFQGSASVELAASILRDNPPPITRADLSGELKSLIHKCLAKDSGERIQTALIPAAELQRVRKQSDSAKETRKLEPQMPTEEGLWVAVLPFKYKGSNADIEALAEGLPEEIVTGLSRFSYLRVIARGSTLQYVNQATDLRTVGKDLGARYVMEGSLRQAGAKLQVAVQLVDATTGAQLWAETYERDFHSEVIFELQDDLVPRIVSTVADHDGVLPHSMAEVLRKKSEDQLSPHEATLRSFSFFKRFTPEEHATVRRILESAVESAPDRGDCWAMLSHLYCNEYWDGFNQLPGSLDRALAAARHALDVAPANHLSYWALALALFLKRDFAQLRPAAERAIELNRMDGSTVVFMGQLIAYSGDWERGCAIAERGSALNPNHAGWHHRTAFYNAYRKGQYEAALAAALQFNTPGFFHDAAAKVAAYGQLGAHEEAHQALKELLAIRPDFATVARGYYEKWQNPGLVQHLLEGIRKAGLEIEGAAVPGG